MGAEPRGAGEGPAGDAALDGPPEHRPRGGQAGPREEGEEDCQIHVGCAGFTYPHWRKGVFYEAGVPQRSELNYYAGRFSACEINSTFYGIPRASTLETWAGKVPPGFRFGLKMLQLVTHKKQLRDCEDDVRAFVERASLLQAQGKLGPLLFQFPPHLAKNIELLDRVLSIIPRHVRVAVEFRHRSWLDCPQVPALLRRFNVALVESLVPTTYLEGGKKGPYITRIGRETADWTYTRAFHDLDFEATGGLTDFSERELRDFAEVVVARSKRVREQYIYFLNDLGGFAPKNAAAFARLVEKLSGRKALVAGFRRAATKSARITSFFSKSPKGKGPAAPSRGLDLPRAGPSPAAGGPPPSKKPRTSIASFFRKGD